MIHSPSYLDTFGSRAENQERCHLRRPFRNYANDKYDNYLDNKNSKDNNKNNINDDNVNKNRKDI